MKKIMAIMTVCAALVACNSTPESPEQMAVTAVYNMDADICGNSRGASEIVAKLQSIKMTSCPADFSDAFRAYVKSWEKMAEVEKKMYLVDMGKATSDMASFVSAFRSDKTKSVVDLKGNWKQFSADIDKATAEIIKSNTKLLTIGTKYGAVYPKGGLF